MWSLGKTDRKYYAMNDGEYQIVATGVVRIGYMNNGYYDTIEEYSMQASSGWHQERSFQKV